MMQHMGQPIRATLVHPSWGFFRFTLAGFSLKIKTCNLNWGLFRLLSEFNFGARWLNKSMDEEPEGVLPNIQGHLIFGKCLVSGS